MSTVRLVGDIGGTHARFAVATADGDLSSPVELASAEHADLESALGAAADRLGVGLSGGAAAIAVAGPVGGEAVELTNLGWRISVDAVRRALGLARLELLNDFEAVARSLPRLAEDELDTWRAGEPAPDGGLAVLGPGTGLGVAGMVAAGERWVPVSGEGGHRDLAAGDDREWRVVERLAARFGRASAERALSGPGLEALYDAVVELDGRIGEPVEAAEISRRAVAGESAACREACELFSGWLGAVAGDLVLTLGARRGLFLAGGMLEPMGEAFDRGRFFARLDGKGRFRDYVRSVPVWRLREPSRAAMRGAASLLDG